MKIGISSTGCSSHVDFENFTHNFSDETEKLSHKLYQTPNVFSNYSEPDSHFPYLVGKFLLKNFKTAHFLIKLTCEKIWRHVPIFVLHISIWRHISSHMSFIKIYLNSMFFSIKFPIEWATFTIILKNYIHWNFNGRPKSKFGTCRPKNPIFFKKKF